MDRFYVNGQNSFVCVCFNPRVTCRTLQCMQVQLDSMMSRAEQLTVAALDSAQEPFAKRKGRAKARSRQLLNY